MHQVCVMKCVSATPVQGIVMTGSVAECLFHEAPRKKWSMYVASPGDELHLVDCLVKSNSVCLFAELRHDVLTVAV